MWTPKRILILVGGVILFSAFFALYNRLLGDLDGLPILPEQYGPTTSVGPPQVGTSWTDIKIFEAFGTQTQEGCSEVRCPELSRPIRLYLGNRGLGMSAEKFNIEPDGRIKLTPFSVCIYPKTRSVGKYPEINIVRCDIAFLTLNSPVKTLSELANRKIVGIELRGEGGVKLENNRGTREKTDDLEVTVKNAPVFYDDSRSLVWSDGLVELIDRQSKPPTQVKATGFELHLAREGSNQQEKNAGRGQSKGEGVSGVELLVLRSNVDMQLYVDPRSGFLASPQGKDPGPVQTVGRETASVGRKTNEIPDKAQLTIQTPGMFRYDLTKEEAHFFGPKDKPEYVVVTRAHKMPGGIKRDEIMCDHLELKFRRKPPDPSLGPRTGGEGAMEKEIESALATAAPGKKVNLNMMETEKMQAWGTSMSYVCASESMGARSVLKGQPMEAYKDGHKIFSPEMHFIGPDKNGLGQQATARGPGLIELFDATKDKAKGENPYHQKAEWSENLIWTKAREGERKLDLLVLTGTRRDDDDQIRADASFVDEEQKQEIKGMKLQVWLEPTGPAAQKGGPQTQQKPCRLEATGDVSAISSDMIVEGAVDDGKFRPVDILLIHFKDEPSQPKRLPDVSPVAQPGPAPKKAGDGKPAVSKNSNPVNLRADKVTAFVGRIGTQTKLQELIASGKVQVHQNKTDKDKGVDIQGNVLNLLRYEQGDILYVYGAADKSAVLQMDELFLAGPKVTINQKENVADVEGIGNMRMPSNTNLDGSKATKPGSILTINWNEGMVFDGRHADFRGGITADQDNSTLKCLNLEVIFDKEISFKDGQKGRQTAKVEKMVCDRQVFVEDETRDRQKRLTKRSTGGFTQLNMDNPEGNTQGQGPGHVSNWGESSAQVAPMQGAGTTSNMKPGVRTFLTRVEFKGRMFSHSKEKETTRLTKFYDDVEVFHFPTNDPDVNFNRDVPPKDGFFLRCNLLTILTRQVAGKSTQVMVGEGQVVFRTDESFGRADKVVFDESADTVAFIANEGNLVTITQTKQGNARELQGSRILYRRNTGEFKIEGSPGLRGGQ